MLLGQFPARFGSIRTVKMSPPVPVPLSKRMRLSSPSSMDVHGSPASNSGECIGGGGGGPSAEQFGIHRAPDGPTAPRSRPALPLINRSGSYDPRAWLDVESAASGSLNTSNRGVSRSTNVNSNSPGSQQCSTQQALASMDEECGDNGEGEENSSVLGLGDDDFVSGSVSFGMRERGPLHLDTKRLFVQAPEFGPDIGSPMTLFPKDVTTPRFVAPATSAKKISPDDVTNFPPPTPYKSYDIAAATPTTTCLTSQSGSSGTHATPRSRFDNDFTVKSVIGSGQFGTVYAVCSNFDRMEYAVKSTKVTRTMKVEELRTLAHLTTDGCENIVRYFNGWVEGDLVYIQTELCDGAVTTLYEEGKFKGNEAEKCILLRSMVNALKVVHREGLVHLDIKPDNIFFRGSVYKLGDFGLATNVHERRIVDDGDSRYLSPEIFNDDYRDLKKCDIFSLGCTLLELCRSRPLPHDGDEWQNIRAGVLGEFDASPALREVIVSMCGAIEGRPSAAELQEKRVLMTEKERELQLERNRVADLQGRMDAIQQLAPARAVDHYTGRRGGSSTRLMRASTWTG